MVEVDRKQSLGHDPEVVLPAAQPTERVSERFNWRNALITGGLVALATVSAVTSVELATQHFLYEEVPAILLLGVPTGGAAGIIGGVLGKRM